MAYVLGPLGGKKTMNPLQELIRVLNEMVAQHRELLERAEKKKDTLISGSIHELASIVQQESHGIESIAELDEQRKRWVQEYLQGRGFVSEPVPLSDLIQWVDDEDVRKQLIESGQALESAVFELKEINDMNQQLLEQSLSYVNHSLDIMTEQPEVNATYQNPISGQKGKGSGQRFFDTKT